MLPRANRVTRAEDYRSAVRRGRRVSTPNAMLYVSSRQLQESTRIGLIVSKSVGNSVTRNLVARRLRAVGAEIVLARPTGVELVVRALPGAADASWATLHDEIFGGLERSVGKS